MQRQDWIIYYPDNVFGYRSHFNPRCKRGLRPLYVSNHTDLRTPKFQLADVCNMKRNVWALLKCTECVTLWTDLGLKGGNLLLHVFLALFLFLQHLPQAVLLVLHLPQAGGERQLLTSLLFKQLLQLRERKRSENLTKI